MPADIKKQFGGFAGTQAPRGLAGFLSQLKPAFISSVIFLLLVLLVWLGLLFWQRMTDQGIAQLKQQREQLMRQRQVSQENAVLAFGQQLTALKEKLKNRQQFSPVLLFLEENTVPQVFYRSLDFDFEQRSVALQGEAASLEALSKQLEIFRQSDWSERLDLGTLSTTQEGRVQFNLKITISKDSL